MRETWQRRACAGDVHPSIGWASRQRARQSRRLSIAAGTIVIVAIMACGLIWAAVMSSI